MSEGELNIVLSKSNYLPIKNFVDRASANSAAIWVGEAKHLGPIDAISPAGRSDWLRVNLAVSVSERAIVATDENYAELRLLQQKYAGLVVWVDLISAAEFANLLWYVGRCKPEDFLIATPAVLGPPATYPGPAGIAEAMKTMREAAAPVRPEQLQEYRALYEKLNAENAAFRLFDEHGQFRSYDLDAFDTLLLSSTKRQWEPMACVLLRAIEHCYASGRSIPGDLIFCHRLVWLARTTKRIELRGDPHDPIRGEIRSLAGWIDARP